MSDQETVFLVKHSRKGMKMILIAVAGIIPFLIFGISRLLEVPDTGNPFWIFVVYFGAVAIFGGIWNQSKVGDRHEIKNWVLYLHRGEKLVAVVPKKQIRKFYDLGKKINIATAKEVYTFVQANYEPETWSELTKALKRLVTESPHA